jgi:hypothetical protein
MVQKLSSILWLFLLSACNLPVAVQSVAPTEIILSATESPASETPAPMIPTSTLTLTPSPTFTPTFTPIPNYAVLRGKVNVERVSCRYGPGAPYLYKYGLVGGSNLEIIGRNADGTWIEVQAIGGNNPCWMNATYMDIKGEVLNIQPIDPQDVLLPQSPYYGPVTGVSAARNGDQVTIAWIGITLKAGDDSEQFPYLIEAWVCSGGRLIFTPIGSYATAITIGDEAGCVEKSHGRVYAVEKHGYTNWFEIPWPLHVVK